MIIMINLKGKSDFHLFFFLSPEQDKVGGYQYIFVGVSLQKGRGEGKTADKKSKMADYLFTRVNLFVWCP